MKNVLVSAVALALSGTAAFAGGPVAPIVEPVIAAPVVAAPLTFGAWQGGYVGGNIGYADTKWGGLSGDIDGTSMALRGGYDWQVDRSIWGLGAEIDLGETEGAGVTLDKAVTLFGRVGYDMGQWMPYVTAGYTFAKGNVNGLEGDLDGYTLGLGGEYRINQNWSAYGEYSVSEFGNVSDFGGVDVQTDKLKAGVNYRF